MATITKITLLDLVQAITDLSTSETETVATIAYLVNSGKVRLCGNFAGATIDLATPAARLNASSHASGNSTQRRAFMRYCQLKDNSM